MKNALCGMIFSSANQTQKELVSYVANFKATADCYYLYLDRVEMKKSETFVFMNKISEYKLISSFDCNTKTLSGKEDLAKLWVYDKSGGHRVLLDGFEEDARFNMQDNLADYVRQVVFALNPELFKKFDDWVAEDSFAALVAYMDDLDNIEKLFSTMERKDITWQLTQQAFEFNEGRKLKSIIGIPTDVVTAAIEHGLGSNVYLIQQYLKYYNGTVDELRLFFDFMSAINTLAKKRRISINEVNAANAFAYLFEAIKEGVSLRFLVNTLARDMIFYNNLDSVDLVSNSRYVRDIYKMLNTMHLPIEPVANIHKWHNIVSRNYQIFKESRADEYAMAAKILNERYSTIIDGYLIRCPETETELFEIGNKYNNCLPTYRNRVIDENAMIFSVYRLDTDNNIIEEIPSVTFEVNKLLDFIQIKTFFDADVTDEDMLELLKSWKRRVKNNQKGNLIVNEKLY